MDALLCLDENFERRSFFNDDWMAQMACSTRDVTKEHVVEGGLTE